jgi:hypothetical protein
MRCRVASLVLTIPEQRSVIMRIKTMTGIAAALAAVALGGSAIATAGQGAASAKKHAAAKKHTAREKTTGPDTDRIQSGNQTAPDVRGKASSASGSETSTAEAPETSSEGTDGSAPSDGPGGHEDPTGINSETQE